MADFIPPSGPPPPKVPEGWKAQWNDQYKEWFYVNLHTKQSQWDRPTEPVYPSPQDGAPPGPPPSYGHNDSRQTGPEKGGYLNSNNPYGSNSGGNSSQNLSNDEAYARKLQEEENARAQASAGANRGASDSYYGGAAASPAPQYGQGAQYGQSSSELPPRDGGKSKGGFLGKLLGKASGGSSSRPQQGYGGYPQQGYQQGYQQGPPQGQYGYAPQAGYMGQGGGYPQQGYGGYQQQPKKSGMGAGGAAALGLGGGLLGGMMLGEMMENHDQNEYNQGYDQGYDNGDNGDNGDYGGGDDMGGGDF